ncbi:MAG: tetratricopeptide repeat protein [Acidobacteriota bacterium]
MTMESQEKLPQIILELGYMSMRTGFLKEARSFLDAAQALRPNDPTPGLFLGMWHFAQGQYGDAERGYRQVLQQHEDHDLTRAYLAEALIAQKRWSEAETALNSVVQGNRDPSAVAFAKELLSGLRSGLFQRA